MSYSIEWLTVHQDGKLALCWLAATNPTAFRERVSKGQLENLKVGKICDQLLKAIKTKSAKNRISLHLSAKLVFGTIKIHQRMVNCLLEDVSNYYVIHSTKLKILFQQQQEEKEAPRVKAKKRSATQEKAKKAPAKRKKTQQADENNNEQTLTSAIEAEITLREVNLPPPPPVCDDENNLDEFFGDPNAEVAEVLDFMESVNANWMNGRTQQTTQSPEPAVEIHEDILTPGSSIDHPAPRERMRSSTPINPDVEIPPVFQEEEEENVSPIPSPISLAEPIQNEEEIQNSEPEDEEIEDLLAPPKRKKRKKTLQIDQIKIISAAKMKNQLDNYTNIRGCTKPKDDIVDLLAESEKNFLIKPLRKRVAAVEPLEEQFERNLKIPRIEDNILDFLVEIIPREPDPNNNFQAPEEAFGDILEDFDRFRARRINRKRPAAEIPPVEMINLELQDMQLMPPPPPPPPVEEFLNIPVQIPVSEVQGNFSEIPPENTSTTEDFTKDKILLKLQQCWSHKMDPIDMSVLLMGIRSRKIAARTFMSLLELVKDQQVKLHGNDFTMEIINISPGNLFISSSIIY